MSKLTKRVVDLATHPATGQVFMRDTELRGFALRITSGSKTFIVEKKIDGRTKRMTIGAFPSITVEQARKLAQEQIGLIASGHDPVAERQARRNAPTWGDLEQMYLARHASQKKSRLNDTGLLTHHLAPWRPRVLSTITRQDVALLHVKMGTQPSSVIRPGHAISTPIPRAANAMVSLVRSMFNLGVDWGLHSGPNPCVRIKKFPETARDRFVTPDELPRLWAALSSDPSPFVRVAFLVSILTGARRSEVLRMKWADVDITQGTWRIEQTKAGRVHLIPLPRPVLAQLASLPRLDGNPYVFCGRWGRSHLVNVAKPWARITQKAGLPDVRIHDLRRTLGSWLVAAGASLPLIGKALNHSSISTTQIYARLQLEPVRVALEANAVTMLAVIAQAEEKQHAEEETASRTA